MAFSSLIVALICEASSAGHIGRSHTRARCRSAGLREANGRLQHERSFKLRPLKVVSWPTAAVSERRVVGLFGHPRDAR